MNNDNFMSSELATRASQELEDEVKAEIERAIASKDSRPNITELLAQFTEHDNEQTS